VGSFQPNARIELSVDHWHSKSNAGTKCSKYIRREIYDITTDASLELSKLKRHEYSAVDASSKSS